MELSRCGPLGLDELELRGAGPLCSRYLRDTSLPPLCTTSLHPAPPIPMNRSSVRVLFRPWNGRW